MKKIILLRGLPGSGKSTWARGRVEKDGTCKRINRDDLRGMIDGGAWSEKKEQRIRAAELALAEMFLNDDLTPIIDDTNLAPSQMIMWGDFAKRVGAAIEIISFTDVPLEVCLERDRQRGALSGAVGEKVIRDMYRKYLAPRKVYQKPVRDPELPEAIIVDADGTLAHAIGRSMYEWKRVGTDVLDEDVLEDIVMHHEFKKRLVIIMSGRDECCRAETEDWLRRHGVPWNFLFMRPTNDNRNDAIVKRELYEQYVQGQYNVVRVFDDRDRVVAVWRELGLKTYQVENGDF